MAMNRKVRNTAWTAIGLGLVAVLTAVGLSFQPAAVSAGPPGVPAPCSAIPAGDGDYQIDWTAVEADPPVNWYVVRKKGDTTPTVKVEEGTIYFWTQGVEGASQPLTFMVRAHNPAGVSPWCEAVVGGPSPSPSPTPTPTPSPTESPTATETPPPGDVNPEQVGIRVFPQYSGATYSNHARLLDDLERLGVRRISGLLTPNMAADEIAFYQEAHTRMGIEVWFAVGRPGTVLTVAQWTQVRNLLSGPLAGMVEVASGWNEPNHQVGGDWATVTANHQNRLWAEIQDVNQASGQDILVGTPPLWSGNINEQYADLRELAPKILGHYDIINWHQYPHGNTGSALEEFIDRQVTEFRNAYGDFPMLNSESGYSTSVNSGSGNPVTEAQQAALVDDLVLFHQERGIWISYFEFYNDPDASLSNREAHFGFVYTPTLDPSTWRDKPAFAVFQGLVQ